MEESIKRVQHGILNTMSAHSKKLVLKAGVVRIFKKGDIIYGEREEVDGIYFVLEGYVALYRNSRYGEIRLIFVCATGEMLNEVVIEKKKTSVAAKALSAVKLLCVPRKKFEELLQEDFDLVKSVFSSLSRKARRLFHQVGNANGTYPLEKHLAAKIWKLARDYGTDMGEGKEIAFEVSVTFLANMLGAKRESVSRVISKMKKEGYLRHEHGKLIICNMEKLHSLV